jgi:hypothetical protein
MFKKAHKNAVAAGLVLGSFVLGLSPSFGAAASMQGRLIAATPFDTRLVTAGALSDFSAIPQLQSAESLFGKARAFRYKKDAAGKDHWQSPEETESKWAGDCEDKAVWLYAQLKKNGYDARLVVGRQNASSKGFHVWVTLAGAGGGFTILDPTAQKRIWDATDFSDGSYRPVYSFDGTNRYRHEA